VAKIEELLPKIEEYGKAQDALNKLNAELPERLKKSILQEAIEGRLVPQDPNDEPASLLLAKIRQEKAQLVKAGKLKKKDLIETPISEDEIPFEIPDSWEWVRLREVLSVKSGEFLNVRSLNDDMDYPVYGGNGINGTYDTYNVESNTLIIGRVGFYCGSIHKTKSKAWVTDNALIVNYTNNNLYVDYLKNVLRWLNIRTTSNSTAQPVVSGKGIYPLLLPLPPLAEQHRIVEKLEQVLGEIDKLKK
jgi:type I restriction enzyme S subunit